MLKFLTISLSLFFSILQSQTITKSIIPNVGDSISIIRLDTNFISNIDLSGGINKNWDVSSAMIHLQSSLKFKEIDTATLALMPTATFELSNSIIELNNTGMYIIGETDYLTGKPTKYKNKDRFLPFPMSQGLNLVDTLYSVADDSSRIFYYNHIINQSGTLKTFSGTYDNTLVLNSLLVSKKDQNVNGITGKYALNQYRWFSPLYKWDLLALEFAGVIDSSGKFTTFQKYIAYQNAPLLQTATSNLSINSIISVYPNPTVSSINISLNLSKYEHISVEIVDILGSNLLKKEFNTNQGIQTVNMDINNLNPGGYFLILKDNSGKIIGNSAFIKE